VSGRHADNVAPALLGGIVLVTGLEAGQIYRLPTPKNLVLALVTPAVAVPTAQARAVLPAQITLKEMVRQSAAVALLLMALYNEDIPLMGRAMEQDGVIEPARQHLMPGLREVRAAARAFGALGTVISGAGPTLCSICDSPAVAEQVKAAMLAVYARLGIEAHAQVARPSSRGTYIHTSEG
jgi:homoserine kinase